MSTASRRDADEVQEDDGPLQYGPDLDPGVRAMFKATYQHFDNRMKALDETVTDGFQAMQAALRRLEARAAGAAAPAREQHALQQRAPRHVRDADVTNDDNDAEFEDGSDARGDLPRRPRQDARPRDDGPRRRRDEDEDGGIGRIKITIPSFTGKAGPEEYLEWEMRVEQIFDNHRYSEERKIRFASLEFSGYALIWWDQLNRNDARPESWREMKRTMRARFVPAYFQKEQHTKLRRLVQGAMTVDEYYQRMQVLMIRTNVHESDDATMTRFFEGLNEDIRDRVDLMQYNDMQELLHQAERAEQWVKAKQVSKGRTNFSMGRRSYSHDDDNVKPASSYRSAATDHKEMSKESMAASKVASRADSSAQSAMRTSEIVCYTCGGRGHKRIDCPNKKRVLLVNDGYVSEDKIDSESDEPKEGESESNPIMCYPLDYDDLPCIMVQRAKEDQIPSSGQRWKIFQSQCKIKNKCCKLIIDGGSYTNIISKRVVDALGLKAWPHPQPHCIEWLYNSGRLKVTHKVRVKFNIGTYYDEVICDVVPMDVCQLLLGRPWQYDRNAIHEGRSNTYVFRDVGIKRVLQPMGNNAIKVDHMFVHKDILKGAPKPRTASVEGGEDDAVSPGILVVSPLSPSKVLSK